MKAGVWNLGLGLVAIALGATGQFALFGTNSPALLIGAGGLLVALGVFQLWRNKGR